MQDGLWNIKGLRKSLKKLIKTKCDSSFTCIAKQKKKILHEKSFIKLNFPLFKR